MKVLILIILTSLCVPAYAGDTPSFSDSDLRKYNYESTTTRDLDAAIEGWEDLIESRRTSNSEIYRRALDKANDRISTIQRALDKDRNAFFKHERLSRSRREALNAELNQLQQLLPELIAGSKGEFKRAQKRNEEIVPEEKKIIRYKTNRGTVITKKKVNKGAVNPQTGEFYPPVGEGIVDPKTNKHYPPVGDHGYTNPQTGEFFPAIK